MPTPLFVVALGFIFIVVILLPLKKNKKLYDDDDDDGASSPPRVGGGLPFLGHALAFRKDSLTFLKRIKEEYGDICTINLAGTEITVILSRRYLHQFFEASEDQLSMHDFVAGPFFILSAKEITKELDMSKSPIAKAAPFNYNAIINDGFAEAVDALGESGEIEIYSWARSVICQITMKVLLGRKLSSKHDEEILSYEREAFRCIFLSKILPWTIVKLLFVPKVHRIRRSLIASLRSCLDDVIADPNPTPFIRFWKAEKDAKGEPHTPEDLADLTIAASFAAVSNSAAAVAEAIIRTAIHPDMREMLLSSLMNPSPSCSSADLSHAWCLEVARTAAPPFALVGRVVASDELFLGEYHLVRGSNVMIASELLSSMDDEWKEASSFDPSRFHANNKHNIPSSHALLNWGGGSHICPGKRMALSEMKGALKAILPKLNLRPSVSIPPLRFVPGPAGMMVRGKAVLAYERRQERA